MYPVFAGNRLDFYLLEISSVIWFVPELISFFTRNQPANARSRERTSGFVLMAGLYAGIITGVWASFSARQFAIPWDRSLVFGVGLFLMLCGVGFRWYAIRVLGKYFSCVISVQPGQTIVEKGPYRFIRHPSYTGAMITCRGFGLALTNWLSLAAVLLGMGIGYAYRVHIEERALLAALGDAYRDYMQRTKRFIPFIL